MNKTFPIFDTSALSAVPNSSALLHRNVLAPFAELQEKARQQGFNLAVASGFRSIEKQTEIWNAKVRGERPVLDDNGEPLNVAQLSERQLLQAILRWSALPGASRHHWGTDFDIYDSSHLPDGYQLQLTVAETEKGGVCEAFYAWFNPLIDEGQAYGFFRPYAQDCGGVSREPWHLSYKPLADQYAAALTLEVLYDVINESEILLKSLVLENLPEIYQRYVLNQPLSS